MPRRHTLPDRQPHRVLWLAGVLAVLVLTLCCQKAEASEVARRVLVLYSETADQTPDQNIWRRGFDMAANYHGLLSEYRAVEQPVPEPLDPREWRAIVCAYAAPNMEDPQAYMDWLLASMNRDIRVIFLTPPHAVSAGAPPAVRTRVDMILERFGLAYTQEQTTAGNLLAYGTTGPHMQYERPLPAVPPLFDGYVPTKPQRHTPWLTVRNTSSPSGNAEGIAVAVSPAGGLALPEYVYWIDPADYRHKWYLDPFAFLSASLGLEGMPALTPTTLNGKRIAMSHIDADGFSGFTNVDKKSNCATVMMEEVLKKIDFPVTASVIQAEVDPELSGNVRLMETARAIFALPNVEPASHSFTHPFYWDANDTQKIALFRDKLGLEQYGIPVAGYSFDPKRETVDSCQWITDHLTPADKPCRMMLWSGSCDPKPFVMKHVYDAGLLNINGGDTIYDQHNDSLTGVSPLFKFVGPYVQVFTGQANENILTNLWTGPYHAYRYITRTMERTGSPRRLMPIDAYYHFYSAEYDASLQAVKDVYAWIATQDVAKVFTSAYIPMVMDFTQATVERDGAADVISGYGTCLSVRYEDTSTLPDLTRCTNVLGYEVQPQGLFVHLKRGAGQARIVRATSPDNRQPYLQSATGWVDDFSHSADTIRLRYEGFGNGTVTLAGLPAGRAAIVAHNGTARSLITSLTGTLTIGPVRSGTLGIHLK